MMLNYSIKTSFLALRPLSIAAAMLAAITVVGAKAEDKNQTKPQHPLAPALERARSSLASAEKVGDYVAEFHKLDIVDGKYHPHTTYLKFRTKPMSAYLRFKEPHEGREVIYVHGKNDGKLLAHETGIAAIVGTVALLPTSSRAMSESKSPITEIGMAKMTAGLIDVWETELKYGEIDVKYYQQAKHKLLGKREHLVIEATHPRPRRQFNYHRARLWIDRETNLPVRLVYWGFPRRDGAKPPLLEEYTYRNLRIDVGLQDIDFDVNNPNYDF